MLRFKVQVAVYSVSDITGNCSLKYGNTASLKCRNSPLLMINYFRFAFGLGAKWRYMGYSGSSLHSPGREIWLLSWLKGMSWGLEKPYCTKLPVAGFL